MRTLPARHLADVGQEPDTSRFASIEEALDALRRGLPVLVLDDADRENEGDVILAAETLTQEWLAWTIRHSSGYICAPMPDDVADRLGLPLMVSDNEDPRRTAYTVTVDARDGVSTGISAADRTRTIRLLAAPDATPGDFIRPGHVLPLRARDAGVLVRGGHTEAAVDLCRLAGLAPVGAIGELVHDTGEMMRTDDVLALGAAQGLPVVTIADLVAWRERHDRVERAAATRLPTEHGTFTVVGYLDRVTGSEHLALVSPKGLAGTGDESTPVADLPAGSAVRSRSGPTGGVGSATRLTGSHPAQVRVHSECLTGDVFGSLRCDCGPQLQRSLVAVAADGGVVVYLRGHEGRGVGLLSKLAAYRLQDGGIDTVDAQTALGLPVDDREYGAAAAILRDLGVESVRLLTNNPLKAEALRKGGLEVAEVRPVRIAPNPENEFYLRTKRERLGHDVLVTATVSTLGAVAEG